MKTGEERDEPESIQSSIPCAPRLVGKFSPVKGCWTESFLAMKHSKKAVPHERGKRLMKLMVRTLHLRFYGAGKCPACGRVEK